MSANFWTWLTITQSSHSLTYPEMAMYIAVMSWDSVNLNKRDVSMATSMCATYLAAILGSYLQLIICGRAHKVSNH